MSSPALVGAKAAGVCTLPCAATRSAFVLYRSGRLSGGAIPSCRRAFGPYPLARTCRMTRRCSRPGAGDALEHLQPHKGNTRRTPPKASAPTVPSPAHHGKSSRARLPRAGRGLLGRRVLMPHCRLSRPHFRSRSKPDQPGSDKQNHRRHHEHVAGADRCRLRVDQPLDHCTGLIRAHP